MIDTHCHLTSLDGPLDEAISGLSAVITVGTGLDDCRAALRLATGRSDVWAALGVHPNQASAAAAVETRAAIEAMLVDPRVVAIGETGFDTHWDKETLASQSEAFEWHAELAARLSKPLVLHVRDAQGRDDASRAAQAAITNAGHPLGVLHCCNGDAGLIDAALDLGWHVSFAGNVTYNSARVLHAAARTVPLERLLAETDSPYLTPVPQRGKKNVPNYVRFVIARLAELKDMEANDLERRLDDNARSLFSLDTAS